MKESAQMAISYLRSNAEYLGLSEINFSEIDIHLHVPEGAVPKDGPSAGITITTSVYSALTRKAVNNDIAMTGEMTLHGKVLPIGGVKEKILSSEKMNINKIIFTDKEASYKSEEEVNRLIKQRQKKLERRCGKLSYHDIKNEK